MDLLKECREELEYAVAVRRYLHAHPEPAAHELQTVRFILSELEKSGIQAVNIPDGGVLGFIRGFTDADISFRFAPFDQGLDGLFALTTRPIPRHLDP